MSPRSGRRRDPRRGQAGGARLPAGAAPWAAAFRQRGARLRRDLTGRRALRGRPGRHHGRGARVAVGPAGGARGAVPAARRLLRAGLSVPDRRRRLPMEPPPDRRLVRMVQRLGRRLRVRSREHDDRLSGRALAAHPARNRPDAALGGARWDGSARRLRRDRLARGGCPRQGRARRESPPRYSRRSGSRSRFCSRSATRNSRSSATPWARRLFREAR